MHNLSLTISSVSTVLFSGDVVSVTLPGITGELTVLAQHEPLITVLKEGTITVRTKEGEERFEIEKGILEVSGKEAVVLL